VPRNHSVVRVFACLLLLSILSGCSAPAAPQPAAQPVDTPVTRVTPEPLSTVAQEQAATAAPTETAPAATEPPAAPATPQPKPTRGSLGLELAADVPAAAGEQVLALLAGNGATVEAVTSEADLRLAAQPAADAVLAWERIFTPVDRMSSVLEGTTLDELKGVWTGAAPSANYTNIYVPEAYLPDLTALLGPASEAVKPQAADALAAALWGDKMGLGIVPFDMLTVKLRAIHLDGAWPADNRFVAANWPLAARAYLAPVTDRGREALGKLSGTPLPLTNRDPGKLTVLIMTGVTAIARNSAVAIDRSGDDGFLARQVGPELAAADITIISNEIPFAPDCKADNTLNNLILCSRPGYFLNLELSGVDAIGLTGNHWNDFGYANALYSLEFYGEKHIPTYGGGATDKTARDPMILEHNGNRLGFLGANSWGPEWYWCGTGEKVSAWAGPENPGAARYVREQMNADIAALKSKVNLVFAEVQHTEFNDAGDYQTQPIPEQEADFRSMNEAGADVVTGVMAHAPQAVELRNDRLILYGLGNLYFDQTWSWPTRTGLVARHTIYDGKLINTELLVTVIQEDFQLRWATPEERIEVLKSVFDVSRW
jgi:hypothetical protein